VFRVDRIRKVTLLEQEFEPPQIPVTAEVGYTPGEEVVRAIIRLGPEARWVADYYPVETVADTAESLTVRFSASDASVIAGLLLRLGRSAELIEGEEVQNRLERLRRTILDRYQ
jgi:proteasome accessory factor C